MERPSKRQRLSLGESADRTGDFDLETARARNDQRLKSLFEGIFEKYGRDFSDIGDEIDLRTGEIVVNKGHVLHMEHEDDTGDLPGLRMPKRAVSQFLGDERQNLDTPDDKELDSLPRNNLPSSIPANKKSPKPSRAIDPRWQPPEIDAEFWTPPKKESPKETSASPRKEQVSSPPTAASVWAIRTPGRPRGSTSKRQTPLNNSKPLASQSKRKRRSRIKLDWSFAQRKSDDSDSDDPLQEEAPPSSNRSVKIRARSSVPLTPRAVNSVSNNAIDVIPTCDCKPAKSEERHYDELIKATTPIPETPEVNSSSPTTADDTPTQKSYAIILESPTFIEPEEVILTPDEVKLIIQMKFEDMDISWEEIVEHLPGRTLNDLLNWVNHRPYLLDGTLTSSSWSPRDLNKLGELADKSGTWWRDFQARFPHQQRREIEDQVIRLWAQNHSGQVKKWQDDGVETTRMGFTERKRSRIPYSDENDTALKTGDIMTNDDLDDLLEEGSDNDWSEISAIDANARKAEVFINSPRVSPRKGSASPRKYY
ncbi:hypothetical protein UA08_07712 [Talaromyces atroroseus]|uniref:Myb-like domain-containing protein n=1 Tax=Talaromyces atroroseus TaxID=1441469 RepID=A0A225AA60_TALAT|nr:hypothetical protein UA08_07712 [Talaromyces atroroseus]OKL57000.1 hypothetical protein UA08_07712 [Talaromyces atroroseus]